MSKLYLMIGLPGSGKTTIAKELERLTNALYICPDDIRQEICGDANDQSKNSEVWETAYKRLELYLSHDDTVIFDDTNVTVERRAEVLSHTDSDTECIAIFVNSPYHVCVERNNKRDRKVPEDVIKRMMNKLQKPYKREGFESVVVIFD